MNQTILELSRKFKLLKQQSEEQAEKLKAVNKEWADCEEQLLAAMVEEGVNSVDIAGVGKLSMRTENYLSVTAANTESFYLYLKESGNGALLKESVNPRTLQAWLKQHFIDVQAKFIETKGLDEISARDEALKFLNQKGANYFTKRGIALRAN